MGYLTFVQTLFASALPNFSQLTRLETDDAAETLLLKDVTTQTIATISPDAGSIGASDFSVQPMTDSRDFTYQGGTYTLDQATLNQLLDAPAAANTYINGVAFYGFSADLFSYKVGDRIYMALARPAGIGLSVYALDADATPTLLQEIDDADWSYLRGISAMTQVELGGATWLLTASAAESGLGMFAVGDDGTLMLRASYGFNEQLPVSKPGQIETVMVGGRAFVVMGAYGSSSLTVLEVTEQGTLVFRDQVIDTLDTRFGDTSALATWSDGTLHLVAAAGADGGLSLFQLLPDGRLLYRESVVDSNDTALQHVADLKFVFHDGQLELYALGIKDAGLGRFRIDLDALATGSSGTVLVASGAGGLLQGTAGDDVLIDGIGKDTLEGGGGADVFIFTPDGVDDWIRGFNPADDRIDLTAFPGVYDISDVAFHTRKHGALLIYGAERLGVVSFNNKPLSAEDIADRLVLAANHVLLPDPVPAQAIGSDASELMYGTADDDTLVGAGGDDTIHGEAGVDVIYGGDGDDVLFTESSTDPNNGGVLYGEAGDDTFYVEAANTTVVEVAGEGSDTIHASVSVTLDADSEVEEIRPRYPAGTAALAFTGSDSAQILRGNAGANVLSGGGGNDTLIGGAGADTLHGGTGTDYASFDIASDQVTLTRNSDGVIVESDVLGRDLVMNDVEYFRFTDKTLAHYDIATITGTPASENIDGTPATERIYGLGGQDLIRPGGGNDTVDGGDGRDMVSFANLADTPGRTNMQYRLDVDLETGIGSSHDGSEVVTLLNIERLTGTIYADRIRGIDGFDDDLSGLGDYDWFISTTGNDRFDGGNGKDMVSYIEWQNDARNVAVTFSRDGAPPDSSVVTGVVVDLANAGNNTHLAAGDTYVSIERITGSSRQDVFYGDGNSNDFRGLGDYDWFVGSAGGRERYYGGDGFDTVTYYLSTSGVKASLKNGAVVNGEETGRGYAGDAALDLYFGIEGLTGTNYDDWLGGNSGRNKLSGLDGNDRLYGYSGIDRLKGGAGDDWIDGGAGSDYAVYDGNRGEYSITRTGALDSVVSGHGYVDTLINIEYFVFDDQQIRIWDLPIA